MSNARPQCLKRPHSLRRGCSARSSQARCHCSAHPAQTACGRKGGKQIGQLLKRVFTCIRCTSEYPPKIPRTRIRTSECAGKRFQRSREYSIHRRPPARCGVRDLPRLGVAGAGHEANPGVIGAGGVIGAWPTGEPLGVPGAWPTGKPLGVTGAWREAGVAPIGVAGTMGDWKSCCVDGAIGGSDSAARRKVARAPSRRAIVT